MPDIPCILTQVEYDGQTTIRVTRTGYPSPGFIVGLFRQGALVKRSPFQPGNNASLTTDAPLTDPDYRVAGAAADNSDTIDPWGGQLEVVTAKATSVTARYDLRSVTVSWAMQGTIPPDAQLTVTLRDSEGQRLQQPVTGSTVTLPTPTPLGAGAQLILGVTAGYSVGPLVVLPLVTEVPAAAQVIYETDGRAQIAVTFSGAAPAGYGPAVTLLREGVAVSTTRGQGTQVTVPLAAPLAPEAEWAVSLAWASGGAAGPESEPLELITAPPTISDAQAQANKSIMVNWQAQPGPPWATAGWARLNALRGDGRLGQPVPYPPTAFIPDPPLTDGELYAVAVASVRGPVRGPASQHVLLANTRTPLTTTVYDGETVDATWPASVPDGTTGCLVEVLAAGVVIATGRGSGGRGSIRADLNPGGSYTARLRWLSGTVTGPPGPEKPVIPAVATVSSIAPEAENVQLRIEPPGPQMPGGTTYVAHLMQGERVLASSREVTNPPTTAVLDYPCRDLTGLTVRVRAHNEMSSGPLGPPSPVLAVAPVITHAALNGSTLDVSWTLPPDPVGAVAATRIMLASSKLSDIWFPGLTGTHASLDIGRVPDPTWSWTAIAVVTGVDGNFYSVSPPSPGVPLLTDGPGFTKAVFDGQTVHAWLEWPRDNPSTKLATGFRLELFSGAALVGQAVTSRLAGRVTPHVPLAPGRPLRLTVTPLAPGAEYAVEASPVLIDSAPDLTEATSNAAGVTLAWRAPDDPGSVISAYQAVFTAAGKQMFVTLTGHSPSQTVPFPADLDALTPAEVAVRAIGISYATEVFGPPSASAPLLRGTLTVTEATVGDGLLRLAWTPVLGDPEGYAVTLTLDGTSTTTWQAGASAALPINSSATAGTVTVQARKGVAASASATATLILGAPRLTTVDVTGSVLTAAWAVLERAAVVDGYELTVRDGDVVLATARAPGTTASVALPADAAGCSVTVAAFTAGSRGPECPPVRLPAPGPTPTAVTISPVTGKATVTWTAVSPAPTVGYLVQRYRAGQPDGDPAIAATPSTSVELAVDPVRYDDLEVAVAVKTAAGTATTTGPFGPRLHVLTEPAEIRDVDFGGRTAAVSWAPIPGATGYALTVIGGGAVRGQADAAGDQTTKRFAVTLADLSLGYQLVVQPLRGPSSGVRSTAPLVRDGLYVLPAPARIVRASTAQVTPQPVTAYLPDLAAPGQQLSGLPITPPQTGEARPPFTLRAASAAAAPMKYELRIDNGALAFGTTRRALADAYRDLLKTAEINGATPRGILALQQAIARLMPQTFGETLYYSYGLSSQGWVDLRPGMVLRVAFSSFDLTAVSGAPQWSSGYTGGTVVDYDIGDYVSADGGGWLIGFDAFVDWLVAQGVLTVPAPLTGTVPGPGDITQAGGADAADLSYPLFSQPFYRLMLPSQLQAATGPAISRTCQQFTIAAAAKWQEINAATAGPGGGVHVAYFRGRAVLRACIRVEVDGTEHIIPVGTSVGNLLDRVARRPPSVPLGLRGVRLYRAPGPAILDPSQGYDAAATSRVRLDWHGTAEWPAVAQDALNLPLLHGDRIVFGADR